MYEFCIGGTFDIHSLESCNEKSHSKHGEYYCQQEREREKLNIRPVGAQRNNKIPVEILLA